MLYIKVILEEYKLYLYDNKSIIKEYPVAIGKDNTPTRKGNWKVTCKMTGNANSALGSRLLGLDIPPGKYYLIHGTNKEEYIGRKVSAGCVRMNNRDIEELYDIVKEGTEVVIV